MCHFISWIETDKGIFYLTDKDIASKRGAELKEYCKNGSDLVGHGAIEYFYGIKGKHKEVTDFIIDKDKIPKEIQEAIKQGKFALMYRELSLLTPKALAEYEKIEKPAWAEYEKIEKPALAKYGKIQKPALAKYEKIRDSAWAEYEKIEKPALAKYGKIQKPALAKYEKIRDSAWAEYTRRRDSALAEYEKIEKPAWAEYGKIQKPAWAEYAKIEKPALAKYEKKCGLAYYALIKDPKNRIKEWR